MEVARIFCGGRGWQLSGLLGHGRTASVFAIGTPQGPRALKLFTRIYLSGHVGAQRRRHLTSIVAKLEGCDFPHLPRIDECGPFADTFYMVMRQERGGLLSERLGEVLRESIRAIVHQIASAAHFLEGRGLCHRDIKCANILISDDFTHAVLVDIENDLSAQYCSPEYILILLQ